MPGTFSFAKEAGSGAQDFELNPEGVRRNPPGRPVRPFHDGDRPRVLDEFTESNCVQISLVFEPVEVEVVNWNPPLVNVKEDKRGTLDLARPFDPEPPRESFDEKGLPAPNGAGEGHRAARPQFSPEPPCPFPRLALRMGVEGRL